MTGTVRTIVYLEERFAKGKKPTEDDFKDLIATLQKDLPADQVLQLGVIVNNFGSSLTAVSLRISAVEQFNIASINAQITQISESINGINNNFTSIDERLDALEGSTQLPQCTSFSVDSIVVNTRTSIEVVFSGQHLNNVNWNIRNSVNNLINNGNVQAGAGTVNLILNNELHDGAYTLTLNGVSCVGTTSANFAVDLFVDNTTNVCEVPTKNASFGAVDTNRFKGSLEGITIINSAPKRIFVGGWVIDKSNPSIPQEVDLYVDGFYMLTTVAVFPHSGAASAHSVPTSGLYQFQFDLDYIFWFRDGNDHKLEVKFKNSSTTLEYYNPNNNPNIDKINVNDGFDGVPSVYPSAPVLPNFTGDVVYENDINPDTDGYSKVPHTNSYNYLKTDTHVFGTCNNLGGVLDYFSKINSTLSGTRQEDSGLQIGIDPYIGDLNFIEDYYRNSLGYTSWPQLGAGKNWNGLPQGVYELHVNGGVPNGTNFGGFPTTKTWNPTTKTLYTKADMYQYNYAKNGAKVYADAFSESWHRVVASNALEIKVKIHLDIPYLSGFQQAQIYPYGFFDRAQFPVIRTYNGSRPFQYQPLTSKETATLPTTPDGRSEYYSPLQMTEKWLGIFNQADTDGVAIVWDEDGEFKAFVHDDNRFTSSPRTIIYHSVSNAGKNHVMPNEVVERKFYLVLGGSAAVRDFVYNLHRMPCTNPV
jgi:hypothetical protein